MSHEPREVRTSGRELALAVLCHLESYRNDEHDDAARLLLDHPPVGEGEGEDALASLSADPRVRAFAEDLVALYRHKDAEIDALVDATSRTWKLARMDRVDRNVVRLATAELIGRPQTPRAAIVSEAVRLAARYGSERSAVFVNGLVEALAQSTRPAASPAAPAAASPPASDDPPASPIPPAGEDDPGR